MKNIKVCIIGGGSRLWAIQFMKDLAVKKMSNIEINLYDIDYNAAKNNVGVAKRICEVNNCPQFKIVAQETIEKSLEGCDLVIISIEPGLTECRYGDLIVPRKYGIYQTVGDTTGPGGILRAKRALPLFFDFAKKISEICPDAWVINYTNPMTLCTAALYKGFPKIKALGCCHEVFGTQRFIASLVSKWFDVPTPDRHEIHLDVTGVNHFTFATGAKWNGIDLMPKLIELANDESIYKDLTDVCNEKIKEEKWFDCEEHLIALSFLKHFGVLGAAGDRHLAEFVPWFLSSLEEIHSYGIPDTPYDWRVRIANEKKNKIFKDDELYIEKAKEEGVDILRALFGDCDLYSNCNLPNRGQITYLPKDRIVETNGYFTINSITPSVAKEPPILIQNMIRRVSDVQDATLKAIYEDDNDLLFSAFIMDPLMKLPIKKARELFDEMLIESKIKY